MQRTENEQDTTLSYKCESSKLAEGPPIFRKKLPQNHLPGKQSMKVRFDEQYAQKKLHCKPQ